MTSLFSKKNLAQLQSLATVKTLYAFDYDGTLAKIVKNPSDAYMTQATEKLLKELTELALVAVVSGRGVDDIKKRIGFSPHFVIGNHGLEGINRSKELKEAKKITAKWIHELKKVKLESGVELENKTYSLAIHFRKSKNKKKAQASILMAIKSLNLQPRIITGKAVLNLLPPGTADKGSALMHLVRKSKSKKAFYIGDDDTDEAVFRLTKSKLSLTTVRVGKKVSSKANYYINRQSEIGKLLNLLVEFLRHAQEKN